VQEKKAKYNSGKIDIEKPILEKTFGKKLIEAAGKKLQKNILE